MGRTDAVKEDHAPSAHEGVLNDPPASMAAALGNARHDARSQPTHIVSLASASERMGLCDVAGDDGEGAKWIARTDGSGGIRPRGEGHSSGCRCAAPMRRFETTESVKRPPEERP